MLRNLKLEKYRSFDEYEVEEPDRARPFESRARGAGASPSKSAS